jgi:iron complex outermembrane receptor protein
MKMSGGQFSFGYNNYKHDEVEADTGEIGTAFQNNTYIYRGLMEERRTGRLSGSFGFWGMRRDYESIGEEALAPPTSQNAIALFTLQTIDFEHAALQFGGRFERNSYNPDGLVDRSFNGFSGSVGLRIPLMASTAFVANYTHAYRAPALEELYNNGPHPGNAVFEIGNPNLGKTQPMTNDNWEISRWKRRPSGLSSPFIWVARDRTYPRSRYALPDRGR